MKSDRRVLYTKNVIKKAILELLEEHPLEKITIKELCAEADINRATFYRHYKDSYDLFEHIERDFVEELYPVDVTKFVISKYIHIIYKNQGFYKEFFKTHINSTYIKKVIKGLFYEMYEIAKLREDFDSKKFEYSFNYTFHGITGVLNEWVNKGCIEPPDELDIILSDLVKKQLDIFV